MRVTENPFFMYPYVVAMRKYVCSEFRMSCHDSFVRTLISRSIRMRLIVNTRSTVLTARN